MFETTADTGPERKTAAGRGARAGATRGGATRGGATRGGAAPHAAAALAVLTMLAVGPAPARAQEAVAQAASADAEATPAIAKADALATALLSELDRLRGDVARLSDERQRALEALDDAEDALATAEKTIDTLRAELDALRITALETAAAEENTPEATAPVRFAALGDAPASAGLDFATLPADAFAGTPAAPSLGAALAGAPGPSRPETASPAIVAPVQPESVEVASAAPVPSGVASPVDLGPETVAQDDGIVVATLSADIARSEPTVPRPRAAAIEPLAPVDKLRGAAYVQAGIFVLTSYGYRLRDRMEDAGLGVEILPTTWRGRAAIRLRTGPFDTAGERDEAIATLRSLGIKDALPVAR